jgi:hypothetical protein
MANQGNFYRLQFSGAEIRNAVEASVRVHLWDADGREDGLRAAHAEAAHCDFFGALLQVMHGVANVLLGGIGKVEALHHVAGLIGSFGDFATIEVRDERAVADLGEPVGSLLDLIVEPPPLLNADKAGRGRSCFTMLNPQSRVPVSSNTHR